MTLADAQRIADSEGARPGRGRADREPAGLPDHGLRQVPVQQKKKAQESRKKSTASVLKEVKVGSQTDDHDVDFKVGHIRDFLGEGHRVKVTVFFRGRSITHPELGRAMLDGIAEIADVASHRAAPRLEGRNMSMMLVAK